MNTQAPLPVLQHLGTLGDTTRCRLLAVLERREFSVSELCQVLQLPQPTVSRHLKVLAEDGWVRARSDGTRRPYRRVDDLPLHQGELWAVVQAQITADPRVEEDRERADAVWSAREMRSRDFFSASADQWDDIRTTLYGIRADLLPLFGLLDPRWNVADLGAGTGVFASAVAPFVRSVTVVDRSPEMLATARGRMAEVSSVRFREGDLETLPIDDGAIDLAIVSLVLHHVADPAVALAEVARVLRPGGRLILIDMRQHDRGELTEEMGHLWPGFAAPELHDWLIAAGLRVGPWVPLVPDPSARGPLLFLQSATRPRTTGADRPTGTAPLSID
ncbi:MAG: metalloregulator ArsR/SmtB family transcription factor [Gemmatimonadetes bacterium]|nr:metalloregulator ArsR/SmtB family transcription factor [Gemmatimonadota bacterium]